MPGSSTEDPVFLATIGGTIFLMDLRVTANIRTGSLTSDQSLLRGVLPVIFEMFQLPPT